MCCRAQLLAVAFPRAAPAARTGSGEAQRGPFSALGTQHSANTKCVTVKGLVTVLLLQS